MKKFLGSAWKFLKEHRFLTVLSLVATWGATKGIMLGMALYPHWPWADLIIPALATIGIIPNWQSKVSKKAASDIEGTSEPYPYEGER